MAISEVPGSFIGSNFQITGDIAAMESTTRNEKQIDVFVAVMGTSPAVLSECLYYYYSPYGDDEEGKARKRKKRSDKQKADSESRDLKA